MTFVTTPAFARQQTQSKKINIFSLAGIPLYVYAVTLSSFLVIIGILWDISWHRSIGRDKFLSPPHILIYMGAVFGGLFSGIQVLWNSFLGNMENRKGLVKIWGVFYSSLGALFCIWGAVAMLTSAPFDDWWHNTYGLDVKILSPPHALLGLGILFMQFGACVCISKYLNQNFAGADKKNIEGKTLRVLQILFVLAAASLLCMICTLATEYIDARNMRDSLFYQVVAFIVLLFLPALAIELRLRWPLTAITTAYFFILGGSNWILQLFPSEPKLGPILNHVTHFQALTFPMLFVFPALAMDIILRKYKGNDWIKACLLSIAFILLLLAIEYPLSGFLLESPSARNWFFVADSWSYNDPPDWIYRFKFIPGEVQAFWPFVKGISIAIVLGILFARVSLRWGKWMQNIQR